MGTHKRGGHCHFGGEEDTLQTEPPRRPAIRQHQSQRPNSLTPHSLRANRSCMHARSRQSACQQKSSECTWRTQPTLTTRSSYQTAASAIPYCSTYANRSCTRVTQPRALTRPLQHPSSSLQAPQRATPTTQLSAKHSACDAKHTGCTARSSSPLWWIATTAWPS